METLAQRLDDIRRMAEHSKANPYTPPPGTVAWDDAEPGDTLENGMVLIARRIRTKTAAEKLAAGTGGQVYLDGPRQWAVVVRRSAAHSVELLGVVKLCARLLGEWTGPTPPGINETWESCCTAIARATGQAK